MIGRCHNPNSRDYRWYGGRGIKVCRRWRSFPLWLKDMEGSFIPGLTLERKNSDKDYCPSNVVWATWAEQRKSQRKRTK